MRYWRILLAIYLLLAGIYWLWPVSFPAQGIVMGIIAIVTAVILLTDR
jgi:hypothetical protein